jgi:hypothetical protein
MTMTLLILAVAATAVDARALTSTLEHLTAPFALAREAAIPGRSSTIQPAQVSGTWHIRLQDNTWNRRSGERWVSIQMRRKDDRSFGMSLPVRELQGAGIQDDRWTASSVTFSLNRDAGRIDFTGSFDDGRGTGDFTFAPNAEFVRAMQSSGRTLSSDDVLKMAIHDVSRSFVQAIEAQGYKNLDTDDLIKMRIHGVDADYIAAFRKAGYDKLSVEDLIKTRIHGATPEFVQEMRAAGYGKLSVEQLVKMRIHGVSASFVKELRDLGYKDLAVEDLVKMRIHGVTPQFIRELKELGYANLRGEELVRFRIHSVTPEFIKEVRGAGFKEMTPDDLVDFAIHGRRWLTRK